MRDKRKHALLCVGGPYDGRRYLADDLGFRAAHLHKMPNPPACLDAIMPESATVTYTVYVADAFRSRDGEVWFWRPADQSLENTMKKLLERYEQGSNIIWNEIPDQLR